ncbi:MAG: endolytic transglycosylase MltG, partial [Gammaproteobacteria bacterium]
MVSRFEEVFTPEWTTRASELGLTVHQVVTLASLVEEEARVPEERPLVASVFMNRLARGMPLASDPTFIYAAVLAHDYDGNPNQPRHRTRLSPYNTYVVPGLPPGPISSPGRASLEAALYPASSDYLYFVVSGTSGRHKFSRTAAEHDVAVGEYRRQQREVRERAQ